MAIGPEGEQVFTLSGAERPYRVLIEAMQEGAATLDGKGVLLYANMGLARMVRSPLEDALGTPIRRFFHASSVAAFRQAPSVVSRPGIETTWSRLPRISSSRARALARPMWPWLARAA